jgi:hypothetical protein
LVDLQVIAGDEPRVRLAFTNRDGTPYHLDGTVTAGMAMLPDAESAFDVQVDDPTSGIVLVTVNGAATQAASDYGVPTPKWGVRLTNGQDVPTQLAAGYIAIAPRSSP